MICYESVKFDLRTRMTEAQRVVLDMWLANFDGAPEGSKALAEYHAAWDIFSKLKREYEDLVIRGSLPPCPRCGVTQDKLLHTCVVRVS